MKIKFLGAIGCVTGSCTWLSDPALKFEALVDCGLIQGEVGASDWNEGKFPFDPRKLTHVFLTHAHLDHCGLLPLLYRQGYGGKVFCTKETAELATLLLQDSPKHGAPYSAEDVRRIHFHEPALDAARNSYAPVHDNVFLKWYRTGHIYGAVSMALYVGPKGTPAQRSIVFSADLSGIEDGREELTLNRARETPFGVDYAVVESTYGDRLRPPEEDSRDARLGRLADELRRAAAGGLLILPCFAIDRTQQVLLDLHEVLRRDALAERALSGVRLLLHANLATSVNAVYARAATRKFSTKTKTRPWWLGKALFHQLGLDPHDPEHERAVEAWVRQCLGQSGGKGDEALLRRLAPGAARRLEVVTKPDTQRLAAGTVLVTGGGMCDGGAIHGYLAQYLHRPELTIGSTGYLSGGSHGARLFALADLSDVDRARLPDTLRLTTGPGPGTEYPLKQVRARFVRLGGYSGHADQASLVRWVFGSMEREGRPLGRRVFVQHGQPQARRALVAELIAEGQRRGVSDFLPEAPEDVDWFDLDTDQWERAESRSREKAALLARLAELEEADGSPT